MAVLFSNRPVSVQSGAQTFGASNVPDTLSDVLFTLKYCTTATPTFWPNANTVLNLSAFMSLDAGATWRSLSTMGTFGGIHLSKGVEVPETTWGFSLFPGINRLIRIDSNVANGPLVSEATLIVI